MEEAGESNVAQGNSKQSLTGRRNFVKKAAAGVTASFCASTIRARGLLEAPTVLGIGAGGKGKSDLEQVTKVGFQVIALADVVDATKLTVDPKDRRAKGQVQCRKAYPDATFGRDYRQMIAELDDRIDAVVVSTPDHHHFHASMQAMQAGKHVYCQKPLTHGIWEARQLAETAKTKGIITQMGNQAHANDHMRRCVELIRAGIVGKVKEVHCWTNRPIWPQGFQNPPTAEAVPEAIDWKQWIGPAPSVGYSPKIAPFAWRGWWDYGTGALGDMACHIMDLGFWAMNPDAPKTVQAEQFGATQLSPPINSKIAWQFAPNQYSAADGFRVLWYDGYVDATFDRDKWALAKSGEEYNHPSPDILDGMKFADFGSVVIGEHGKLFFNRGKPNWILKTDRSIESFEFPKPSLPRATGQNNYQEWFDAVTGRIGQCESNFQLAARMTETILLGVLAQRAGEGVLHWNAEQMSVDSRPDLDKHIRREYADGWSTQQMFGIS